MATFSMGKTLGPSGAVVEFIDTDGVASINIDGSTVVTPIQQAAVADAAAPTGFTPSGSGAVTVVSNAATDLDTTQAALDTLVDEVTALTTTVNTIIARLEAAGIIAS